MAPRRTSDWDLYGEHANAGKALYVLREMEKALAPVGWHVALGGGVLRVGYSSHDLDVIIFPHTRRWWGRKPKLQLVYDALEDLGMWRRVSVKELHRFWREKGSKDTKHVEVWSYEGRRIDLIVLS